MSTPLDAGSATAGSIFSSSTYIVPQYQREYSWEEAEVEEFFNDLAQSVKKESYFLGLIIVTEAGESKEIIDGQQRMLTLTLLAAALWNAANDHGRSAVASRISSTFLKAIDYETDEERARIRLSSPADDSTLQYIISGTHESIPLGKSDEVSRRLALAYKTLKKLLWQNISADPFRRIGEWTEFLMDRLYMARFIHSDSSSAYKVFEIINTRGRELTTADLLKSFVLNSTATSRRDERYEEWQAIASSFEDSPASFVQFIRHAVTLSEGYVQARDLYDVLTGAKGARKEPFSADRLMALLHEHHAAYLQMILPATSGPAGQGELEVYSTLNALNVSSVRPILLAIRQSSNAAEGAQELLRLVMRRVVVGTLGTGAVERKFGQAAKSIAESGDWRGPLEELWDLNPEPLEFQRKVYTRSLNRNVLFVLRSSILQRSITPDLEGTLYFIRPRSADWSSEDADRVAYWVNTIGNTFISDLPRRPVGSSEWSGFVSEIAPHGVSREWVSEISSFREWEVSEIEELGSELAKVAAQVWY